MPAISPQRMRDRYDAILAAATRVFADLEYQTRDSWSRARRVVGKAEHLVGTPHSAIVKKSVPGGHIGLFMGSKTLAEVWPEIGHWMKRHA